MATPRTGSAQAETGFRIRQGYLVAGFKIGQPFDHRPHERAFVLARLVVLNGLNDRHSSTAAGQ